MKDLYGKEIPQSVMDAYENELVKHEAYCLSKMPYLKDAIIDLIASLERVGKNFGIDVQNNPSIIEARKKLKEYSEWQMMRSCDAPNKPGYYRANND